MLTSTVLKQLECFLTAQTPDACFETLLLGKLKVQKASPYVTGFALSMTLIR